MSGTTKKLIAAVEEYFADLQRVRASGGATQERSLYGPLGNLLTAIGATLKRKVFCVQELADQGVGHPDFGLYAAKQVQRGAPREGQTQERAVVEVKSPPDDAWLTAEGRQAIRYWGHYRLVLVTNARDFVLVGEDSSGRSASLETLQVASTEDEFLSRLEEPNAFARDEGARLGEYLARALSHRATLTEPRDLARLLASYARDGLSRVEAAGGAPQLAAVRGTLEEALGICFEGERGQCFFRSTLVQTLFYGIFSAWVLWARTHAPPVRGPLFTGTPDDAQFRWREADWHLHAPVLRALFRQIAVVADTRPQAVAIHIDQEAVTAGLDAWKRYWKQVGQCRPAEPIVADSPGSTGLDGDRPPDFGDINDAIEDHSFCAFGMTLRMPGYDEAQRRLRGNLHRQLSGSAAGARSHHRGEAGHDAEWWRDAARSRIE